MTEASSSYRLTTAAALTASVGVVIPIAAAGEAVHSYSPAIAFYVFILQHKARRKVMKY